MLEIIIIVAVAYLLYKAMARDTSVSVKTVAMDAAEGAGAVVGFTTESAIVLTKVAKAQNIKAQQEMDELGVVAPRTFKRALVDTRRYVQDSTKEVVAEAEDIIASSLSK